MATTKALVKFIAGRPVSCHQVDYDRKNNRPVAVCFAGKDDLQALRCACCCAGQMAFAPMRNKASKAAEAVNKAMIVYSIAMLRCPLLFERRSINSICYLRGLSMQNMDF